MSVRWLFVENQAMWPDQAYYDYPKKLDREDNRLRHLDPPVGTADDAIARVASDIPDVVLLDFGLPGATAADRDVGVSCAEEIARICPSAKIVILSNEAFDARDPTDCERVRRLNAAGVMGYILKDVRYFEAADALLRAADDQWVFRPGSINALWRACLAAPHPCFAGPAPMTESEHRVVVAAARGEPLKMVANRSSLAPDTVSTYLKSAGEKVGHWPGRAKLLAWSLRHCPDAIAFAEMLSDGTGPD